MKYIKSSIKYIVIVLMCVCCSYYTTRATNYTFDSANVTFNNSGTSISATNVKAGLEEVFSYATNYTTLNNLIGTDSLNTLSENLIDAINEIKNDSASHYQTLGTISDLNTIPLQSIGSVVLAAAVSPSGAQATYSYWKGGLDVEDRYTIVAINHSNFLMYMYDMYDGTSKGWKRITNTAKLNGGTLASGNLNAVRESGIYYMSSSNSYTNMPDGKTEGVLELASPHSTNSYERQIFYLGSRIYVRSINSSDNADWDKWYKYTGTAV